MIKNRLSVQHIIAFLGSRRFFWCVVGLFVLQAAWIAFSGRYPMAFDEDYHLGLIRLYANHFSPFWSSQPAGADVLGAVARDPSYLYSYLMAIPYRLIAFVTSSEAAQVICLRMINIGLFASGLVVYHRLLLKTGASRAVVHVCILLFILVPVVPLLAAQVNYDNLFIPLVGILFLLTVNFSKGMRTSKHINSSLLLMIAIVGLAVSLVKYAALPIVVVLFTYLALQIWRHRTQGWQNLRSRCGILMILTLIVVAGLFVERYGINLVRYHTPVPDCAVVLSEQRCYAYPPWGRDHILAAQKADSKRVVLGPWNYTKHYWLYGMWLRLFFAVDGPQSQFETRGPLAVPALSAIGFAVLCSSLLLVYGRRIFRRYDGRVLVILILPAACYLTALWLNSYQDYRLTSYPVALNGRYLLPILPIGLLLGVLAVGELLQRRIQLKLLMASTAVFCLLWGGGALTFILRSNDGWYWHNSAVTGANHAVKRVLGPLSPGYDNPLLFIRLED